MGKKRDFFEVVRRKGLFFTHVDIARAMEEILRVSKPGALFVLPQT
jgi:hypothetical protein